MINKSVKYSYKGVNKDVTKSKHPFEYYYDAQHIRILSTDSQSTASVTNEKGNKLIITIPDILINTSTNIISYSGKSLPYLDNGELDQQITSGKLQTSSSAGTTILNIANTRTGIVIFTTDSNNMDCIWYVPNFINGDYNIKLLYIRNLNFDLQHPIQSLYNYENENIQKVYWVDGLNQIRFINIENDNIEDNDPLIDLPSNNINFVGNVNFSQPKVIDVIGGGTHTSGMIQYAYNLYRKNGSQTKISPLTELVSLDKGDNKGGGDINEVVGATPIVRITGIDSSYTHIKIYAIKYTSYNQIPSVSLIEESEINDTITIYDDGNIIESLSLEEFLFLGSNPIIPNHIQTKDNRLFPTNIKDRPFLLPDELDFRAYSFSANNNITIVFDLEDNTIHGVTAGSYTLEKSKSAVNRFPDIRKYLPNSTTTGGEGKFLKYQIINKPVDEPENKKFFKDREIYRIAIEFYNSLGQTSLPQWIADIKANTGNLIGQYNTLKVTLKPEFYTFINNYNFESEEDRPVGYRILRAERNANDRTIISQGALTPMMFQVVGNEARDYQKFYSNIIREQYQDTSLKIPSYLSRNINKFPTYTTDGYLNGINHLGWLNDDYTFAGGPIEGGEIFSATNMDFKVSQTFQYTKIFQLYSPDVLFDESINYTTDLKLKVIGQYLNTENGIFAKERKIDSKAVVSSGKAKTGLNPWAIPSSEYLENNNFTKMFDSGGSGSNGSNKRGFISFSGNNDTMDFLQFHRQYNTFVTDSLKREYEILGSPEITERGAEPTFYDNDPRYDYSNSLQSFISDGSKGSDENEYDPIQSINSWGARCTTIVLGTKDNTTDQRKSYEDLFNESSLNIENSILTAEIVRGNDDIFNSSIYGGFSYEDKKRTNYIAIGEYQDISNDIVQIDNPGDTFVGKFKFLRIGKTETEVYSNTQLQITEVIEFPVETSVDLKNRNDISLTNWDSRFQPRYDEYHKYNRVYSQENNLVKNTDIDFNSEIIKNFDTRIQTTKLKIPNERIDSWTDILANETMDLNGKFGPINNIVEYKDELYTFQDEAIAKISINPRIQISASEGAALELGRGGILYDYDYLTTKSGSINKWGIKSTKRGIYYYDALNKGIGRVPDSVTVLLSDKKGLHTEFESKYNYSLFQKDNPIVKQGVTIGHDNYNNDIYFTFYLGFTDSFTRVFNESIDEFVDLKTYKPSIYNYKGDKFISTNNQKDIYLHGDGEYNKFYGVYQPSYIILQVNPESDIETVFNTIHYNSEIYLNDVDQPNKTITHIQAYNEYQNSGLIPLVVGRSSNLRRKFREWQANIPRDKRNRIRNSWIYLKLELQNTSNYKMILHDVIINYSI